MAPKQSRPLICSYCHRGGHRSFECPHREDATSTDGAAEPRRGCGPPRDPCWSRGELHWFDECRVQQERKQQGACLICGLTEHWMKACPEYETKVRDPAPGPPANHLWCLRCGCSDHATAKCSTTDPQVNFPPDDGVSRGCLFCGIFGHDMQSCLRRVPQVQGEQASKLTALASDQESQHAAILQLQTDVKALQSSHKIIQECKTDVVLLNNKVSTLMSGAVER